MSAEAPPVPQADFSRTDLSPAQKEIADELHAAVSEGGFAVHLLDGVTGSGKTEVYFEALAAAVERGLPALVLLPEISLTAQFLSRFTDRFGAPPALWHSALAAGERKRIWRAVAENRVPVLVGARSALFLPWQKLGVVVIDEEHDGGFKQEDGLIYNARDMAVVRARFEACPVVLSSATPSLESVVNVRQGRYRGHRLHHRFSRAPLPEISLVDMRATPPPRGRWLVSDMIDEVAATLEGGRQALLFLNRRGFAPLTLCRACGYRYACPSCDAWMVAHDLHRRLMCHHCGHVQPLPRVCDACGAEDDKLAAVGPGVERIAEEIADHFPDARRIVLSSDHRPADLRATIRRIADGDADIVVGTQIVAKGHHFPMLDFVGVVDADLGLGNGDLRAAERTYQMLAQVAGRAGRSSGGRGRAMLQSHMPDHPVLQALAAGDRDGFLAREAAAREAAGMPPFGRLASLIVSAPTRPDGAGFCDRLAKCAPSHPDIRVLGPAPAPIARLRGRYRFRFLLKGKRGAPMQSLIRNWLAAPAAATRGGIRVAVDIDPYHFL